MSVTVESGGKERGGNEAPGQVKGGHGSRSTITRQAAPGLAAW